MRGRLLTAALVLAGACAPIALSGWKRVRAPVPAALPAEMHFVIAGAAADEVPELYALAEDAIHGRGYRASESGWTLAVEVDELDRDLLRSLHRLGVEVTLRGFDESGKEIFAEHLSRVTSQIAGPQGLSVRSHLIEIADGIAAKLPRVR